MTGFILWSGAVTWGAISLAERITTGHFSDHIATMSTIYLCAALIHGGRK